MPVSGEWFSSSTRCRSSENSHSHLSTLLSRFLRRRYYLDYLQIIVVNHLPFDFLSPLSAFLALRDHIDVLLRIIVNCLCFDFTLPLQHIVSTRFFRSFLAIFSSSRPSRFSSDNRCQSSLYTSFLFVLWDIVSTRLRSLSCFPFCHLLSSTNRFQLSLCRRLPFSLELVLALRDHSGALLIVIVDCLSFNLTLFFFFFAILPQYSPFHHSRCLSFDFVSSSSRSFWHFVDNCFQISLIWLCFFLVEIVSTILFLWLRFVSAVSMSSSFSHSLIHTRISLRCLRRSSSIGLIAHFFKRWISNLSSATSSLRRRNHFDFLLTINFNYLFIDFLSSSAGLFRVSSNNESQQLLFWLGLSCRLRAFVVGTTNRLSWSPFHSDCFYLLQTIIFNFLCFEFVSSLSRFWRLPSLNHWPISLRSLRIYSFDELSRFCSANLSRLFLLALDLFSSNLSPLHRGHFPFCQVTVVNDFSFDFVSLSLRSSRLFAFYHSGWSLFRPRFSFISLLTSSLSLPDYSTFYYWFLANFRCFIKFFHNLLCSFRPFLTGFDSLAVVHPDSYWARSTSPEVIYYPDSIRCTKCNLFHYRLSSRRTLKSLSFGVSKYSRPQKFLNLQERFDAFEFTKSCFYVENRFVATLIIRWPIEIRCFLAHIFRKTIKFPLLCILKNEVKTT